MNVVYAVSRAYEHKILPSVRSLLEHNPKAKIYVLAEGEELTVDIPANVIDIRAQEWFTPSGVNYKNPFSYITLLKVCYPSLLRCNKVLHLDADTIVCDSLEEMWGTDIKGKWFAAADEKLGHYHPFGEHYYNMGVALINLQQMRTDGIQEQMVEYLNTVPQPWADQDAWNKYGIEQDKIVELPTRYNECFATGKTEDPAIIHYCGMHDWWERQSMERKEWLDKYR